MLRKCLVLAGLAVIGFSFMMTVGCEDEAKKPAAVQAVPADSGSVTVWVNNSNGSKTPVMLKKMGPNFVGPKGEFYPTMPTEDQLKPIYGF